MPIPPWPKVMPKVVLMLAEMHGPVMGGGNGWEKEKLCFWIPRMGVFELHNAIKYAVASGVALQTPIPLNTTSQ